MSAKQNRLRCVTQASLASTAMAFYSGILARRVLRREVDHLWVQRADQKDSSYAKVTCLFHKKKLDVLIRIHQRNRIMRMGTYIKRAIIWLWRMASPKICRESWQEGQWCSSDPSLKAWELGKPEGKKKLMFPFEGQQKGRILSYPGEDQPFCSSQAFRSLGETHPHYRGQSALFSLPI